jgi:hypothetical protein
LSFYYDKPLSEEEEELVGLADTEFIADFPSPDYTTDSHIIITPYPKEIQQEGYCVYFRYELHAK